MIGNEPSIYDMNFPKKSGYPDFIIDENQLFKMFTPGSWQSMSWTKDNHCRV